MNANKISYDDRVKPKNVLALNEKVAAIRRYEADPVYKSVGRYFNCSPDQIKRIIKQKNEILAEWNNRTKKSVLPTSHELKSVRMSFLGKAVHEWIRRMMYYTDFNLTNALIQTMAIEFKKVLGLQNFFPDKNWIANFRTTYGLREVNTKTLHIGYQESHSVQIRDILRHLRAVCGPSGSPEELEYEEGESAAGPSKKVADPQIKEENNCENSDADFEMIDRDGADSPCCSTSVTSPLREEEPAVVPFIMPAGMNIKITTVKSEAEAVQAESDKAAINTHDEAINCVKLLEEFALLKENFRLIGLIERLEEALKEK